MSYVWYEVLQDTLFGNRSLKLNFKNSNAIFFLSERNTREETSPAHWNELEKL